MIKLNSPQRKPSIFGFRPSVQWRGIFINKLICRLVTLIKECFVAKLKTKKHNIFENRNEIKNKKYNNGKPIELGQIIKFKTNGKIWGRMQTESKNIGKTTTYTHFRIFRFPIFDTHPRLSFIRFQFDHFSILWFAIPNFDFQIFDTFKIHVSIIH